MTEEAYIKRLVKLETKLKDARHEMACLALGIPASLDAGLEHLVLSRCPTTRKQPQQSIVPLEL